VSGGNAAIFHIVDGIAAGSYSSAKRRLGEADGFAQMPNSFRCHSSPPFFTKHHSMKILRIVVSDI
ncbi:MAG: hypothetical protein UFE80_01135, partial [Christensenellales bacterium]|nr:hypothetical protein [Christensenellales bacterium]